MISYDLFDSLLTALVATVVLTTSQTEPLELSSNWNPSDFRECKDTQAVREVCYEIFPVTFSQ